MEMRKYFAVFGDEVLGICLARPNYEEKLALATVANSMAVHRLRCAV